MATMEGYAKVAHLMGTHPEFAIFRCFSSLNMQNLLYLQAEIIHLEAQLRTIVNQDINHGGRRYHSKDWWSLSHSQGEGDLKQWNKVLEIRTALKEYSILPIMHDNIVIGS